MNSGTTLPMAKLCPKVELPSDKREKAEVTFDGESTRHYRPASFPMITPQQFALIIPELHSRTRSRHRGHFVGIVPHRGFVSNHPVLAQHRHGFPTSIAHTRSVCLRVYPRDLACIRLIEGRTRGYASSDVSSLRLMYEHSCIPPPAFYLFALLFPR